MIVEFHVFLRTLKLAVTTAHDRAAVSVDAVCTDNVGTLTKVVGHHSDIWPQEPPTASQGVQR